MCTYGDLRPWFFVSDALVEASTPGSIRLPLHRHDVSLGVTSRLYFREPKEYNGVNAFDTTVYTKPEVGRITWLGS
jgi:3-isopropylmalate dehydrogenase